MNKPLKMLYRPTETDVPLNCDVYDIYHTQDIEGNIISSYMVGWVSKQKEWIVAPIWCFQPTTKNTLKED